MIEDIYPQQAKDELWLIKETKWVKKLQGIRESQFCLGNGYLSIRGSLEDHPYDAKPGAYIAGLYDRIGSQVDELVNLPNPVNFTITTIEGQKFDMCTMDVLSHERVLNMKKGLLVRRTQYRDVQKRKYNYQSMRFVSMHNKNIGVMQIVFTPLDKDCVIDVVTGINTAVTTTGGFSEGRKKHFRVKELGQHQKAGYLVSETLEQKYTVVEWSGFYYQLKNKRIFAKNNILRLKLKRNQTIIFTKIFCIKHFRHKEQHQAVKDRTFKIFKKAFYSDFATLLTRHVKAWEKLWKRADIIVEGTNELQKNLRFNIYHMLICAQDDKGFSSVGARTLSGDGYRGHIFWDADIFLLPFYLFNFSQIAKSMLLYRYNRLDQSRELARKEGFKGAKFAWESASTGQEETPEWARDIDGIISKVYTHKMEHHITADIAYAVYKYYEATDDAAFMENYGYELIFETARFWASRVTYNKRKKKYEILHVIGPDEFHVDVNNNAFTNVMAKWNLLIAHKLFNGIKKKRTIFRKIKKKLDITDREAGLWKKIATGIGITLNKNKIMEQFDGYFKLKRVSLTKTDENGIPMIPGTLKAKNIAKTQLSKQPDVLMLLYLLGDVFSSKTKNANYNFYINRTVHKSSLSSSVCAILACEMHDLSRAYNLFNVALNADISNCYGNTDEGIHAASLGGVWQAIVSGFAGVRVKKGKIWIRPIMPHYWQRLAFSFLWKKNLIKLDVLNDAIKVKVISGNKSVKVGIYDKPVSLERGRMYIFKRKISKYAKEACYY